MRYLQGARSLLFQKLLRIYSYLFALVSAGAYLALGLVSKVLGTPLSLDNMPWKGDELLNWLFGLGILGIGSVVAAVTGSRFRFLLPIYAVIQAYLMIKGNFMGAHSFDGASDFQRTLALTAGSVVAALASLLQLKKQPTK